MPRRRSSSSKPTRAVRLRRRGGKKKKPRRKLATATIKRIVNSTREKKIFEFQCHHVTAADDTQRKSRDNNGNYLCHGLSLRMLKNTHSAAAGTKQATVLHAVNGVPPGLRQGEREGRKISLNRLTLYGYYNAFSATANTTHPQSTPLSCTIMLCNVKDGSGGDGLSSSYGIHPNGDTIYQMTAKQGGIAADAYNSDAMEIYAGGKLFRNAEFMSNISILAQKRLSPKHVNTIKVDADVQKFHRIGEPMAWEWSIDLSKYQTEFQSAGTVGDDADPSGLIRKNALFLLVKYDVDPAQAAGAYGSFYNNVNRDISFQGRLSYYDS